MQKLTAQAFAAAAVEQSGRTREELDEFRARLKIHDTSDVSEIRAAVRRLVAFARLPNVPAPPAEERRIRWAVDPRAAHKVGCSGFDLMAVAAIEAAERYPGDFGR